MRTNDPVNRFCVNRLDDLGKMRDWLECSRCRNSADALCKTEHEQNAPSSSGEETDGALLCTSFQLLVEAFGEMRCVFLFFR